MPIESMPLYVNIERIHNELHDLGHTDQDVLHPDELFPFDQFHYHGTDAVDKAARHLQLNATSRVLEIGSGVGGPARYLAHTFGCHMTALELQGNLHLLAESLTFRTGLTDRITHVLGDALTYPLPDATFDAVVSWLAIHHIPDRPRLLARCAAALKQNGQIYIEDLYERTPFQSTDLPDVTETIFGVTLTSIDQYVHDLHGAGFRDIQAVDMTTDWTAFCIARSAAFHEARDRHIRVHGAVVFKRLDGFFSKVVHLFKSGSLGGICLRAGK